MNNMFTFFAFIFAVGSFCFLIYSMSENSSQGLLITIALALFCLVSVDACTKTTEYKTARALELKQEIADQTPKMISEKDGCQVYTFKSTGYWHYFTKCPNSDVTTDTTHTVRNGKYSHDEHDLITTTTK